MLSGVPAACLHICGLPERLALLQEQSLCPCLCRSQLERSLVEQVEPLTSAAPAAQVVTTESQQTAPPPVSCACARARSRRLYLLQWFSLVAPLLGLPPLPPDRFQQASARLLVEGGRSSASVLAAVGARRAVI